jgi:hypothetical protein
MTEVALADWGFEPSGAWEVVPASDPISPTEQVLRRPSPRRVWWRLVDIERREDLQLDETLAPDVAALPGRVITINLLLREASRKSLESVIDQFFSQPLSWGIDEPTRMSEDTRLAASRFIELLPDELPLPQIAPDGEGGLVLHWERQGHQHILGGVDGWKLHFVLDAGQAHARYFDNITFTGDRIPQLILDVLAQ